MEIDLKDLLEVVGELYVEKRMLEKSGEASQANIQQIVGQYEQRVKELVNELNNVRSQTPQTFGSDYVNHLEDTVQKLNARIKELEGKIKELESGSNSKSKKRDKSEPTGS